MNIHYTENNLKFSIDSIKKDPKNNYFILGGWAFDSEYNDLAQEVYIRVDHKFYKASYGCERQDVAVYYNKPEYKNCGFFAYVILKNAINKISIYIKSKNNEIYNNKKQSITYDNRTSFPVKIGMNCISNNSIYLRSNGDLVCWCDFGVGKVLQHFNNEIDYAKDVYLGEVYNYIRKKLYDNTMPFPEFCKQCLMLQVNTNISLYYYDKKIINTFNKTLIF